MHRNHLLCRFWWLAPVAVLAIVLTGQGAKKQIGADAGTEQALVNLKDKNISLDFSLEEGSEKGILWKAKLGKVSYAGPVIAGGKVFVATNNENPRDKAFEGDAGVIMCFDAKSGKFLWQTLHEKLVDDAQNYPKQGIASTPFIDGDRLFYVSNRCELVCADVNGDPKNPGKGKIIWSLDMIKDLKVFPCQLANSSPLVVGDLVFVVTGNGVDVSVNPWKLRAPEAPSFLAVNKKTGKVIWKDNSPGVNIMEGQWTGATYAKPKKGKAQVIFPGGDGWLYAFEPENGKLIWKFNCNPKKATFNAVNKRESDKCAFLATPVIWEDRCYIGVGQNPDHGPGVGHLWCIDITRTGDVTPPDESFDPKNPKNKDSALVWHYGGKIVPAPEKRGREIYFGRTLSTAAIKDGLLYIGELDGYFHCFDARTGKHHYEYDMKAGTWSSPYWVDDKVFLGNEDGDLVVFPHGDKKPAMKPTAIAFGPPIKTPVKVADGILYVMADSALYAIKGK